MKNVLILISLLIWSFSSVGQSPTPHTTYTQKNSPKLVVKPAISKKILHEVASGKAYLIDVRTPEEYAEKHLKYAQNINIRSEKFASEINTLSKKKKIYLYCRSGNRSGKAADTLQTFGYKLGINIGGLDSLVTNGLPLDK